MKRTACFFILLFSGLLAACRSASEGEGDYPQDNYTHSRARWSPAGSSVAFTGRVAGVYGIHVVDTSGGTPVRINTGEGIGVDWSPDGAWIAFSAVGSLYRITPDGDSLSRLTLSTIDIRPAWSPDGGTIAFVRSGVWLLDVATGNVRQLTPSGDYPRWLPGGAEVMVMRSVLSAGNPNEYVYMFVAVDTATGATREVASYRSRASVAFPVLDSAGGRILFSTKFTGQYAQVQLLDVATSGVVQLTEDGGDHPSWSPDGQRIVFTRTFKEDGGLWTMNADGTERRRVTLP